MLLSILLSLIALIVALSILITVHEFGHFWVARYFGVHVERFSIGFGKVLWRRFDRYNTEFVISLIPFGGYVKMFDKRINSTVPEMCHYAFNHKAVSQRIAIIAAGPIANFMFSIFAYWLVFLIGIPSIRPVVEEILPNSIAESAKITPGMELKAIDGIETPDWDTVRIQLVSKIGSNQTRLSIAPFGSYKKWQDKILNLRNWNFDQDEDPVTMLGILPIRDRIEPVLEKVLKNSAASAAGLQASDRIIKVNGQPLREWMMFVNLIRNNPGKPLVLDVKRQDQFLSFTLIPNNQLGKGFAGIVPKVVPIDNGYKILRQYGPFNAIFEATVKTWQIMKLTVQMLEKLITGKVKLILSFDI